MLNRYVWAVVAVCIAPAFAGPATLKFDFGPGPVGEGMMRVLPEMMYSDSAGFGFEPGASMQVVNRGGDPVTGDFCTAGAPFFFSVAVPQEGDYRATVTLGDREGESVTTIKAELRRLMVEKSALAFAAPEGRQDNTHHNNYGSYELAQCLVQGLRDNKLGIAKDIVDDFKGFDPAHPDPLEAFVLPASPTRSSQRPLGN